MVASGRELAAACPFHVQVTDPNGGQMHESKTQHQGQFAFTTKVAGEYQACFSTHGAVVVLVLSPGLCCCWRQQLCSALR